MMLTAAILLCVALWLNRKEPNALLLTLLIGISAFIPVPPENFYLNCAIGEFCIFIAAWSLNVRASQAIMLICFQLEVAHLLGFYLNGYPPESPYRTVVPFLEHLELVVCSLFSYPIFSRILSRLEKRIHKCLS